MVILLIFTIIKRLSNLNLSVERSFNMLRIGHLDTVNFLTKFPTTKHIEESLKLDVGYFSVRN